MPSWSSLWLVLGFAFVSASAAERDPANELPPNMRRLTWFGERADWSADGTRVLFLQKTFGDVFEAELATGRIRPVTHHFRHHGFTRALYLSNGDVLLSGPLAYDPSKPGDARTQCWLSVLPRTFDQPPVPLGTKCSEGPAVSRSRLHLAWTHVSGQYPDELPKGASRILEADIVYEGGRPRLSGRRVALGSASLGFACTLETQNFVPPNEEKLTVSLYGHQGTEVGLLDLASGRVQNLTNSPEEYDEPEGVFPEGRFTLVECDRQNRKGWRFIDLWKLALDGSGYTERLTRFSDYPGFKASNPVVSDDGRRMAFQLARTTDEAGVGYGIFVLDFPAPVVDVASRLELFADGALVDRLEGGTSLRLHAPQPAGEVVRFDAPWEGAFTGYVTVLRDGERFRMYYRGLPVAGADGSTNEVTCYAESPDGIHWRKPDLGLFEVLGSRSNNAVLAGMSPFSHNFAPFLDRRPGVAAAERYKALAGTSETGLHAFASEDGLRWRRWREPPLLRHGAFDSQNVGFWSESEQCYVIYFRTWTRGDFAGFRTVSRATSKDFATWSAPVEMVMGEAPAEHLYTSQTHPYFRAPHLYVATPMRFIPGRQVLTPEQARSLGVAKDYSGDVAEAVFMTSRGGNRYERPFLEGFVRPGPDLGNWASRAGLSALGIVPTGPAEMSLYKQAHYAQPSCHLVRYRLRTDGFVSVNATFAGGVFVTRPLRHTGRELVINFSTGASGGIRVELLNATGQPLKDFGLEDAVEQVGDEIERVVRWKGGKDLGSTAGEPIRLRFTMKDADLFSFRFR